MDRELRAYLGGRFVEVNAKVDEGFTKVRAEIEKSETNLLTAFHGWARGMERPKSGSASWNFPEGSNSWNSYLECALPEQPA
jgi:hypothetical protein